MNKANVFLLVVVSSLITYISTATQPAATAGVAGVAQEKWEYGFSAVEGNKKFISYRFESASKASKREVLLNRDMGYYYKSITIDEYSPTRNESESFEPGSGKTKEDWCKGKERLFEFDAAKAHASLGDDGWHPYQVILVEPDEINRAIYRHQTFWRRRIQ